VPRASSSMRRAGTTEACSDGLMVPMQKPHGAGSIVPALQKAQEPALSAVEGRGTHSLGTGSENTETAGPHRECSSARTPYLQMLDASSPTLSGVQAQRADPLIDGFVSFETIQAALPGWLAFRGELPDTIWCKWWRRDGSTARDARFALIPLRSP